jgi:crotonobetainyl-CoA:carnitine CoA-transferase CaiB-like acyl-CoA transferase
MSGPLHGIRVIDLTAMASGPFATAMLGDQGADVIKVEAPGQGDLIRYLGTSRGGISALFANINRNKRGVVINLAEERGVELLHQLCGAADVFVQNFRPGVVDRMGIGEAAIREANPELIYVSISGYGETGPYAQRRVYDSVMQAISGIAAHQANPETGVPEFVHNIICDKATALYVAQAVSAALFARERGSGGQHVRLSMLEAGIGFLWPDGMQNLTLLGEGGSQPNTRSSLPVVRETADGYITLSVIQDGEFAGLCRVLGQPELKDDPRFCDATVRARNNAELHAIVNPITSRLPTAELARRLEAEDVPHAVINSMETLHEDPQVVHRGNLIESEHPFAGRMRQPRPVAQFDGTPASLRRPAPALGEHTDEVFRELGLGDEEIAALRERGVLA